MRSFIIGDADKNGGRHRGWFIGHFIKNTLRHSDDVEIKWNESKKDMTRKEWSVNKSAHTQTIIIEGRQRVIFPDESFDLGPGDYFLAKSCVSHKYKILVNSKTISVRWPSLPSDHKNKT